MDQDSRTDESRERALSSEPSSTRPNPFDDDDSNLSARKRRRTSLSGSRSTSVETALSHDNTIAASDSHDMKVDTPEPTLPSTPAHSDHAAAAAAEPVSSRVTINLRNADSLEATPTSPISPSPTPSRQRPGHVRASVEAPEVDMVPTYPMDDASSSCTLDSPGPAAVSTKDLEDEVQFSPIESQSSFRRMADLNFIVSDFPYRYDGELPQDTVARLSSYFRQRKSHMALLYGSLLSNLLTLEPGHVDEGLLSIHNWVNRCLSCARPELRTTITEVYRENRIFWSVLPDLFYQFGQR